MNKPHLYLVCDYSGELYLNDCGGRAVLEDGTHLSSAHCSNFLQLEKELLRKVPSLTDYEIINLIEKPIPEQFKLF